MLCALVMRKNGKSFADIPELIKAGVPWPTMILLATAMTIASAIGGETGIKRIIPAIF